MTSFRDNFYNISHKLTSCFFAAALSFSSCRRSFSVSLEISLSIGRYDGDNVGDDGLVVRDEMDEET